MCIYEYMCVCVCVVFQTDLESAGLPVCDAVVNLAGENILNPLRRSEHTRTHTHRQNSIHIQCTQHAFYIQHTHYIDTKHNTLYTHILNHRAEEQRLLLLLLLQVTWRVGTRDETRVTVTSFALRLTFLRCSCVVFGPSRVLSFTVHEIGYSAVLWKRRARR